MSFWILLAAAGFILAAAGLLFIYRKVCAGDMRKSCFFRYLIGVVSLFAFAMVSGLMPERSTNLFALFLLLPAVISITLIIRSRSLTKDLQ
ncbi:hypothetical protein H8E52_01255 [bacterium]|nr:hypothetical protein [bacterium]